MTRINLIPPEIVEKRRDEKRWRWVVLAAIGAVALVGLFYLVMWYQVTVKQSEVAALKQEAGNLQSEAVRFRIFQQNEADLASRETVVKAAAKGRVDWARIFNEVSMVLPTDMFLLSMNGNEPSDVNPVSGVVNMTGQAVDQPGDNPDNGLKSIAKAIVRLSDLSQLDNVWLVQADRPSSAGTNSESQATQPLINWSIKSRVTPGGSTAAAQPWTVPTSSSQ